MITSIKVLAGFTEKLATNLESRFLWYFKFTAGTKLSYQLWYQPHGGSRGWLLTFNIFVSGKHLILGKIKAGNEKPFC